MTDGVHEETVGGETAQYRAITESASDAIVTIDATDTVRYANPAVEDVFGYTPDELVGESFTVLLPPDSNAAGRTVADRLFEHERGPNHFEFTGRRKDGREVDLSVSVATQTVDGERRVTGFVRDISDRVRREQAMRDAYEVISDHETPYETQVDRLLEVGRRAIGTEFATLSRVRGDQYVFEAIAGPEDSDIEPGDSVELEATNCERVVDRSETLVLNDVEADAPDLAPRAGNADWGISCYLGAPVFVNGEVYGTFCFYDTKTRSTDFSDWQITFVELFSNWVGNELEQRRYVERLVALNELNDVVRAVSDAVLSESTRSEIERRACEALAEADSYLFAWIGEANPTTQAVELRTEAGVEGYLDDVSISVDPDEASSRGPTGRALMTGRTQTVSDVEENPDYGPWREHGRKYGYRSSAAIPLVYEDTTFGVLNVYTARENAFHEGESAVLDHLGAIIGHAIVAAERREVLLGDTVVELDLRIVDALDQFGITDAGEESVVFDAIIPISADDYLVSGTTDDGGYALLERVVDGSDRWTELTAIPREGQRDGFEVVVTVPPIIASLDSISAEFVQAFIDGTDVRACVHLPKNVDVRRVLDVAREVFPDTTLVSKQEVTRERRTTRGEGMVDLNELTEKQLSSLRTAYRAGYFEWPRGASGKDVAKKLNIAPATFSQHLRAVERKIFRSLLDDSSD